MTHYADFSGIDGIKLYTTVEYNGPLIAEATRLQLPEGYMKRLEDILGDARASVSTSLEATTSEEYGNKAGAHVSVKLTCGQNLETVLEAISLAQEIADATLRPAYNRAKRILDEARGIVPDTQLESVGTCSVCNTPQFLTPSGVTCEKGHGGAPSAEELRPAAEDQEPRGSESRGGGKRKVLSPRFKR